MCGSASFITDVIPDTTDPVWLPLSRRACIAPVHNAYSQVYVGVFDYDGERETDDFAGRVAIDIPKLQAGYQYDFMLPLRQTSRVYRRDQKCGFIRLRLELNWKSERAALLTYLPRNVSDITKRMKAPREPVTVVCPDAKSFCNVATTVYGVDVPGRYNKSMQVSTTLEIRLIREMMMQRTKRMAWDIFRWKNTLLSLYFFISYMYFVITNSIRCALAFLLSLAFLLMLRNYLKYNVDSANSAYGHKTLWDMTRILLLDRDGPKVHNASGYQRKKPSMFERALLRLFGISPSDTNASDSWRYEDNSEFPFSSGSVYPKLSIEDNDTQDESTQADQDISMHDFSDSDDESVEHSSSAYEQVRRARVRAVGTARVAVNCSSSFASIAENISSRWLSNSSIYLCLLSSSGLVPLGYLASLPYDHEEHDIFPDPLKA